MLRNYFGIVLALVQEGVVVHVLTVDGLQAEADPNPGPGLVLTVKVPGEDLVHALNLESHLEANLVPGQNLKGKFSLLYNSAGV